MTQAKKMLHLLGVRKRMPIDSDGDGVTDIMDCRPYDKTRQDVTVTAGGKETKASKWWKKKKVQMAERRAESKKYRELERTESRKAAHEERMKYARKREEIKTETGLKAYRKRRESGGVVGQFVSGFKGPAPKRVTYTTKRKGKKGKKGKRRVTRTVAPRRKSLTEHMSQFKFEP